MSAIWWTVPAMILLGIVVWTELCVPMRGDEDVPAKIVGLLVLLGLIAWGWGYGEMRWPILATLPVAYGWRRLRKVARLARTRKVLLGITGPFLALGGLLASFGVLTSNGLGAGEHIAQRAISPDGHWEAHLVEHPGIAYCVDEIVLAPRGLATLDPTAYPTYSLGETTMEGELDHFFWSDKSTLVLFIHPQTPLPPILSPNPHVAVKVVNLEPPPSESEERLKLERSLIADGTSRR